ncbi:MULTISPECIES: transcription elongation factor NusA [unclassified Pyrobaculum]|jgi:transcription antitermination factor NusA-like protein|uniref:transcription elongation factor NusA n=1 Tax=unclassified Pyrobaculum TaxID=2643434 RepID=UPI0021DA5552|nr:transcription elongation factor NusA [Pyrobaculum sp. 3827-6]MCU7788175.1 transcription elongation factor NusA [Pyrobaculum sp. 3827-6]
MVKIPFCEFCVKTRVLCQKCQSLIDSGRYQWLDVEVSDALLKVSKKINLADVEYVKSYEVDDLVIVLMRNVKRIPRGAYAQLEKELSSQLGRSVKIVEHGNVNEVIAQLVSPARLLTISTSWLPDGTTETVVKIPSRELRRLPIRPERLQAIIGQISGANVKVELVRERELRA